MELRQIRYFQAVAAARSFSAAARSIHIAQPALTRQVKALEAELEVSLFTRHAGGVVLTAAGQAFYQEVQHLLSGLEGAAHRAKMIGHGMSGELSVGVTVMILWAKAIRDVFKTFRTHYPDVMLKVNTMLSGPQINAIEQGELDAGILMFPPVRPGLDAVTLFQDRLVLVAPADSSLARHPPQRLQDLSSSDFVWFDRANSPTYHDQLLDFFHRQGLVPKVIEKGSDAVTMLALVASGVGCTIVPQMTLNGIPEGLIILKPDDLDMTIDLQLVWRTDHITPVLQNLIDIARCLASSDCLDI